MNDIFDKVMETIEMVGTDMPAYKALFDTVLKTLPETDQRILKQTYEEALVKAEEAHERAQKL